MSPEFNISQVAAFAEENDHIRSTTKKYLQEKGKVQGIENFGAANLTVYRLPQSTIEILTDKDGKTLRLTVVYDDDCG